MCLIAFALHASPHWPLVIAANRDEFLDRPTEPLARWTTSAGQTIVSGRDLRAGGAWFGITPGGRIAFLTNVREAEAVAAPRSRGELVTRWLESAGGADAFLGGLAARSQDFAGFNLVLGDAASGQWHWVTNRLGEPKHGKRESHHEALLPGIYGLSNAALDSPWPKTVQLKSVLDQSLRSHGQTHDLAALQTDLWRALASGVQARTAELPATGIPLAHEKALSSAFVDIPEAGYGTRSSTLLTASAGPSGWQVQMEEREHERTPSGAGHAARPSWQARSERFYWPVASAAHQFTAA